MIGRRGLGAAPAALLWFVAGTAAAGALEVEVIEGPFATVNAFIVSNGKSLVVIDTLRKSVDARRLVDAVKARKLPLTHVYITHGHTDHFTGMPLFRVEFPSARIVVASEDIRRDIKAYAVYMDSGGETGAEPALERPLRRKSASWPGGFDYENWIEVLPGRTLEMDGGGTLELDTAFLPAEAPFTSTVYVRAINALFLSDLGYNGVHHWQGDDITLERIANWRAELQRLEAKYAPLNPVIYPGHGKPTDAGLFGRMVRYIDDYTRVVTTAKSRKAAMAEMIALYPEYAEADFFLKYSVENHVGEAP
jgi:glyoxylase-like metal-dependent hydrolase (beta-lactamase superfamily II)